MSASDDMTAIDAYFRRHANDPGAAPQYAAWRTWFDAMWWFSDADVAEAEKRRDILNQAIGQPDLVAQGYVMADKQPPIDVSKEFAGGGKPPTIQKGSRGASVVKWQTIIGVTADGNFGSGTDAATRAWQTAHGITADGIVGPATWAKVGVQSVSDITPPPAGLLGLTAPAVVPAGKPATTFQVPSTPKPVATGVKPPVAGVVSTGAVQEAGIMGSLSGLPTWAKWGAGLLAIFGIGAAVNDSKKRQLKHK